MGNPKNFYSLPHPNLAVTPGFWNIMFAKYNHDLNVHGNSPGFIWRLYSPASKGEGGRSPLSSTYVGTRIYLCPWKLQTLKNDGDPHYPGSRGHVPWGYMLMISNNLFCPCILKDTLSSYMWATGFQFSIKLICKLL